MVQQDLPEKFVIAHRIDATYVHSNLYLLGVAVVKCGHLAKGVSGEPSDSDAWHCSEVNARLAPKNGLSSAISGRLSFHLILQIMTCI